LLGTARVVADITHVSLSIAPEAVFEGFSRRVDTIEAATVHPPRLTGPAVEIETERASGVARVGQGHVARKP
jgi:hypothetical protein